MRTSKTKRGKQHERVVRQKEAQRLNREHYQNGNAWKDPSGIEKARRSK